MLKLLPINDFAKAGLNTDLMPWDLPGSFLTRIFNVRISRGKLSPFGGFGTLDVLPTDFQPGFLMHVGAVSGDYWLITGRDRVYIYDGISFLDISLVGGNPTVDEDLWVGCMITNVPIINNFDDYPMFWPQQSPGVELEYLPWDATRVWKDVGEKARIVRSHKQFLFALDLFSNSEEIQDGVRWSAPADIGSVPPTWDHLDTTNVAGFTTLGGDGGRIIDGLTLRDAFVVYRERSISIFDYIGGNFVWRVRHLSTTIGLISSDCVVEVKGVHYFIGDGDILFNDGNTIRSLLHNKIRLEFTSNFDPDTYKNSYAVKNNISSEIWFCVPQAGHIYPNIAYIFNWEDGSWTVREIPEAPFANYGTKGSEPILWSTQSNSWNSSLLTWNRRQRSPMDDVIISVTKPEGIGQSGSLLLPDITLAQEHTSFDSVIERISFALEGLNNVTTISRVYPHARGPGKLLIQIGSQDHPGSPIRWKPAVEFDPENDRKIDVRTTGELHCFRFSSFDTQAYWEISGVDIEYTNAGTR